jgi:hypothetical protein
MQLHWQRTLTPSQRAQQIYIIDAVNRITGARLYQLTVIVGALDKLLQGVDDNICLIVPAI